MGSGGGGGPCWSCAEANEVTPMSRVGMMCFVFIILNVWGLGFCFMFVLFFLVAGDNEDVFLQFFADVCVAADDGGEGLFFYEIDEFWW